MWIGNQKKANELEADRGRVYSCWNGGGHPAAFEKYGDAGELELRQRSLTPLRAKDL